jgi:hypothetical protein
MRQFWAAISVGVLCLFADMDRVSAADGAPTGAWRTTNQCFLAAFLLTDDGRAEAIYLSGERDATAVWTWDGSTLRITSRTFDLDSFSGTLKNDRIEADYVWHDMDNNQLHPQACEFERFEAGVPL